MRISIYLYAFLAICFLAGCSFLQAQNGLYITKAADIRVQAGAGMYVQGDIHLDGGNLNLEGDLEIQGDWYLGSTGGSLAGMGTVILKNSGQSNKTPQRIICSNGNMTGNLAFYNLEVDNNAALPNGLVILEGGNVEVKNQLSFSNSTRIRTSPNPGGLNGENPVQYPTYLHISNPGFNSIVNPGGAGDLGKFIEGRLRRSVSTGNSYVFPVGIDPGSRLAFGNQIIQVGITGGPGGIIEGSFTRNRNTSIPTINACNGVLNCNLDHGYWNLDLISGAVASYDLSVSGANPLNLCPASSGEFVILYRPGGMSLSPFSYSSVEANVCGSANWSASFANVTRSGFTSFSDFAIGRFQTTLPVSLVDLRANPKGDYIKVEWLTSQEINSSHFDLERSTDGMLFEKVATLAGAGNSSNPILYKYLDYQLTYNLKYYYRLKMHDLDGNFTYSNVVESRLPRGVEESINVFPNPAQTQVSVGIFSLQDGGYTISIYDMFGKEVVAKKGNLDPGLNTISMELGNVTSGHYLLKARSEKKEKIEKLVISR